MIASPNATRPLEEIAQAASGSLWLQLYTYGSLEVAGGLVRRAINLCADGGFTRHGQSRAE